MKANNMDSGTLSELPVETAAFETGNVLPLLHEIRHALQRLVDSGEATVIDLRSLPMAPGEEARIEETLGRGEVQATLDALGPTEIHETSIPGVWWIVHYNEDEAVIGKFIEIARFPSVLHAQTADIQAGIGVMNQLLSETDH